MVHFSCAHLWQEEHFTHFSPCTRCSKTLITDQTRTDLPAAWLVLLFLSFYFLAKLVPCLWHHLLMFSLLCSSSRAHLTRVTVRIVTFFFLPLLATFLGAALGKGLTATVLKPSAEVDGTKGVTLCCILGGSEDYCYGVNTPLGGSGGMPPQSYFFCCCCEIVVSGEFWQITQNCPDNLVNILQSQQKYQYFSILL